MYWKTLIEGRVKTRQKIHYRGICDWWYSDAFMDIYWKSPKRKVTIIAESEDDIYIIDQGK